jgi:hypothetical protein
MKNSILIFNLSGGFTDMKKNLISIILFIQEYGYTFTIRFCTARPQTIKKNIKNIEEIEKNDYMYDVTNLFDEKTFLIYNNYIPFEKIKNDIVDDNTFDFKKINISKKIFTDISYRNKLSEDYKKQLNDTDKKFIYMGEHFCFYANYNYYNILCSLSFNESIIPSQKIINAYNNFISNINSPYNFIHYRYEADIEKYVKSLQNNSEKIFLIPKIDDLIQSKLFKNNNLNIYIASSYIETFHDKGLLDKNIDLYDNLFYNKNKLDFFDENAFVDFLIGMKSDEIIGFSKSGFSDVLNKLKNTNNYYDKV